MISFTVRMTFRPDDREEIATILRELAAASRQEPGCVSYIPHRVESDPDTIVIYEQYRDMAALDAHRTAPRLISPSTPSAVFISACSSAPWICSKPSPERQPPR